jgi:hypothetical protein
MKKFSSIAIALVAAHAAYAQDAIKAGTIQLGGAVSYQYSTSQSPYNYNDGTSYRTTTEHFTQQYFTTYPSVGYFIADNLAVGLTVGSTSTKRNYTYDNAPGSPTNNEYLATQFSIGPFVQYYRMLTPWFGLAGTFNVGYSNYFQRTRPFISQDRSKGLITGLQPSLVFFPTPKLALGTSFGSLTYNYSTSDTSNFSGTKSSGWTFNSTFGLSYLTLSGTYYFRRSKT